MNTQQTLFQFPKLRRKNGQFCTPQQLLIERVGNENMILKGKTEMYYRMWLAASKKASRLERELMELKKKIGGLLDG